jgi:serine/threonine protein kinase
LRLAAGSKLGPYTILSALGAGGMGEVYRARDGRLDREVALKILSAEFAGDAERLQRFAREAQTLAALNHPHIAQIYGLEDTGDVHALIMELVEGEDLSARIGRGPIPVDEAIPIAAQIAEAIEAAHDLGIVHRDLKPANVKVRTDGTAKVLDFGLAKALDTLGLSNSTALANSPTIAAPIAVTSPGMLLGTGPYMSPEQARGKAVDKRSDIWAFGVVLYEMLTGRNPFGGDTVTDVLSAVISTEPDWKALPSNVSGRLRWLLKRSLEKNPRLRLRDIGEARVALIGDGTGPDSMPWTDLRSAEPARVNVFARVLPWIVAVIALAGAGAAWLFVPRSGNPPPRKLDVTVPSEGSGFALSPDGHRLAFFASGQVRVIDLRRRESRDLAPVPAGSNRFVFWSPDSAFVGYSTSEGKLWKIEANGGAPLLMCAIPESGRLMGATWRADQSVVFAVWRGGLYQVAASGGEPRRFVETSPEREIDFHYPLSMPDGRVLVTTHLQPTQANQTSENTRVELLDGERRVTVLGTGFTPVAYVNGRYLLAQRFGVNAGLWVFEFAGNETLRPEDGQLLAADAHSATAAQDGSLLYSLPSKAPSLRELVWVDRAGRVTAQIGTAQAELASPALSPDGRRIAYSAGVGDNKDIWIRDLQNNIDSRLTFDTGAEVWPAWFPAGRRVAYTELRAVGLDRIASRNVDGSGERHELSAGMAPAMSQDGRFVLYLVDERGGSHLRYSELSADGTVGPPRRVFNSTPEPSIGSPRPAPDARFLAYVERPAGGAVEVFLTQFPTGAGRWQVSRGGGDRPVWAREAAELIYLSGASGGPRSLMAAPIRLAPEVIIGVPVKLFEIGEDLTTEFDVTPDAKRFVMIRQRQEAGRQEARWVLMQNWQAEVAPARGANR